MAVFRIQLKQDGGNPHTFDEILYFLKNNNIIGVGWSAVVTKDVNEIDDEITKLWPGDTNKNNRTAGKKAIKCMASMQKDDLIWTRIGGSANSYFLCKVNTLWKDRQLKNEHVDYDAGNYVGVDWIEIGTQEKVPGKVVNSFIPSATAQHVYDVETISKLLWNRYSDKEYYSVKKISEDEFWQSINSEELECLVFLYLQSLGYYIYSSTIKLSTPLIEGVLINRDTRKLAYVQVKSNSCINSDDYIELSKTGEVFLFSTSGSYGNIDESIHYITKPELQKFIKNNYEVLPDVIKQWVRLLSGDGNCGQEKI